MPNATLSLSGQLKYTPPVPSLDSSMNPTWIADVLEQMVCSGRKEEEFQLTVDGDTVVNLGSLATNGVNAVVVKVATLPTGPVIVKLTSAAGVASAVAVDGFLCLISQTVPYTAMSIARPTGVQVTVRVLLFGAAP